VLYLFELHVLISYGKNNMLSTQIGNITITISLEVHGLVAVIKQQKTKKRQSNLRAFAWSKTDQEGKLIGPGIFTGVRRNCV
jgi:hypothetical protein